MFTIGLKIRLHGQNLCNPNWIFRLIKNPKKKEIVFGSNDLHIENFQFTSLQKIGISVPFFKEECTMILEAQFEQVFAHVHITFKSRTFLDIFNQLTSWKDKLHE